MNILIKNIDIVTCDDSNPFVKSGNIGIKDTCIEFIDSEGNIPRDFNADRIIDGKHRLAMPGLVNAHTHSAMTLLRNYADDMALEEWLFNNIFPVEAKLTDDDVYWGSLLGMAEMIKSGTTCIADMYLHMDSVAQAITESGIKANICKGAMQFNGSGTPKRSDATEDCLRYFKQWNKSADGRIKVYLEVHSVYLYDEEWLKYAASLAKKLDTGIHIHVLETATERKESIETYGMDSAKACAEYGVFDVPVIAAHCVHVDDEGLEIFKNKNVNVVHNPTSNLKLGSGIARIPDMLAKGINVALGTDGAASNNNLDMFEEMHIASLIQKGVHMNPELTAAEEIIKMATVNGAKAVGFGDETGCIKKGMKADMILLDTDKPHLTPLHNPISAVVYSAQSADVDTVIVNGNILMENRRFTTIDEERVKSRAAEISRKLIERV